MAGIQQLADKRVDSFLVDPKKLVIIPGWNVRDDSDPLVAEHIRNIADGIKATGIQYIPTLTVYVENDQIIVTDGYCRTKGALLAISEGADVPYLPVRPEERYADEADRTLSMLKRNEGLPLTPIQQANVVKRLLSLGLSSEEVARRSQKSISHINNMIALLSAPTEVKQMVTEGVISSTLAVSTIRKEGPLIATESLKKAVDNAKSAGKLRATAKHIKLPNKPENNENLFRKLLVDICSQPKGEERDNAIFYAKTVLSDMGIASK